MAIICEKFGFVSVVDESQSMSMMMPRRSKTAMFSFDLVSNSSDLSYLSEPLFDVESNAGSEDSSLTVCLYNVPERKTPETMLQLIVKKGFSGKFDMLCLPMFSETRNMGFCYIRFPVGEHAENFVKTFTGARLSPKGKKRGELAYVPAGAERKYAPEVRFYDNFGKEMRSEC